MKFYKNNSKNIIISLILVIFIILFILFYKFYIKKEYFIKAKNCKNPMNIKTHKLKNNIGKCTWYCPESKKTYNDEKSYLQCPIYCGFLEKNITLGELNKKKNKDFCNQMPYSKPKSPDHKTWLNNLPEDNPKSPKYNTWLQKLQSVDITSPHYNVWLQSLPHSDERSPEYVKDLGYW